MATVQESFLCANTDHHKLHQKSKSGHVAPFDDQPNGHSFGLINEFLLCQYEDADYFHADSVMADSSASAKPKGHTLHSVGLGSDSGDGYSFVFTRRWTAGNRPASATDNNGTLFVIAVRHRDDCDKFEVDFKFNTRPLALMSSMMSYEIDESAKSRSARRQNVALVLNIPDSILQRQLLSVGATSISLGKDVIPLAAECHFTLQKADSLHDKGFRHDAFSVAKIPGTVKEALLPRGALGSYRDLNKTKLVSCTFGGTPVEP